MAKGCKAHAKTISVRIWPLITPKALEMLKQMLQSLKRLKLITSAHRVPGPSAMLVAIMQKVFSKLVVAGLCSRCQRCS